jgi:alkaline phosphatase D
LIPEDAFPGALFLTSAEVEEEEIAPELTVPYVDVEQFAGGAYADALRAGARTLGVRAASVRGNLSVPWINLQLEALADGAPAPIDETDESLERGLAYHQLLKTEEFSQIGSRYVVAQAPFEALAAHRFRTSNGASERLMGDEQRSWFLDTFRSSTRTFKVWGSEIAFLQKHLDLTGITLAPPELQQRIGLTAEDWDGFPNERRELLRELAGLDHVVVFSGDLHCFFAGTPFDGAEPSRRLVEFTIGSVSSTTWMEGLRSIVASDPSLPPEVAVLAPAVGTLLMSRQPPANPHLAFQELGKNGYAVVDVSGDAMDTELFMLAPADVASPAPVDGARFTSVRFRVPAGSAALERPFDGGYERWDTDELRWVART